MRPKQYTITRRTVHVYAEYLCQRYIRLKDHGPKCKAGVLWAVLFWAASRISSLAAACATLRATRPSLTFAGWPGDSCWQRSPQPGGPAPLGADVVVADENGDRR